MRNIGIVIAAAIKSNLRLRSVAVVLLGVVFICVIGVAAIFISQVIIPDMKASAPDLGNIANHLSVILFATSIISIGVYANVFAFQSLTREKARGNIQALLATPLLPREIWLGKSLAVFLPGLILAELVTLAVLLIIDFVFIVPQIGFVVTPWMIIANFLVVPLLYLSLILLVHIVGLTGKPSTANVIVQIFLPVIISLFINLAVRNILNAATWPFMLILIGLAAVIGILVFWVLSRLSAERIILS